MLLLIWAALGLQINWGKGQYGQFVEWIGAVVRLMTHARGPDVRVELPRKKLEEVIKEIQEMISAKGMISSKRVQRLAGKLSWMGSFFPWLLCYNSSLWASLVATRHEQQGEGWGPSKGSARKRPSYMIVVERFGPALR